MFIRKVIREIPMIQPIPHSRDAQPHPTNHKEIFIPSPAWFYPN